VSAGWEAAKQGIVAFYEERLARHGDDVRSVGWRRAEKQRLRFAVLADVGGLHGASLLDVGCGLGDLYAFLREAGIQADYTGCDLSSRMIEAARAKHPEARFLTGDVLSPDFPAPHQTFDFVLASGIFALPVGDETAYRRIVARLFALCRRAAAFNMISTHVDYREAYLHYSDPGEMLTFCRREVTPWVALRHDYLPYEFTVYLSRMPNRPFEVA